MTRTLWILGGVVVLLLAGATLFVFYPWGGPSTPIVWQVRREGLTFSSPRLMDLNGDGIPDVVAGRSWGDLDALDGRTGEVLWHRHFDKGEIFTTTPAVDLNGDGVPDVVLGGRSREGNGLTLLREGKRFLDRGESTVYALDGPTGETLWDLAARNPDVTFTDRNFSTAVPAGDWDNDGVADLLLTHGGGFDEERLPSRLLLVSGKTGKVLRQKQVADGREAYAAAIPLPEARGGPCVLVGTGGETLPGHLFKLTLPDFEEVWRIPSAKKGFVASPAVVRLADKDVAFAATFDGELLAVDLDAGKVNWRLRLPGHETYASPGVGRFNDDDHPDVVAAFMRGEYPDYPLPPIFVWVDGKDGTVLAQVKQDEPRVVLSTPLVLDGDGDGLDEVLFCTSTATFTHPRGGTNHLEILDGRTRQTLWQYRFDGLAAATPALADLDADGRLDLVHVYLDHMARLRLPPSFQADLRWNSYLGEKGDGVVRWAEGEKAGRPLTRFGRGQRLRAAGKVPGP